MPPEGKRQAQEDAVALNIAVLSNFVISRRCHIVKNALKPSYKDRLLSVPITGRTLFGPITGRTLFGPVINRAIEDVSKDPQPVTVSIKNPKQSGPSEAKRSKISSTKSYKPFKKPEYPARRGSKRRDKGPKKPSASVKKTST